MTPKYYKHWAESDLGEGVVYFEISDGFPIRQVEIYGDKIFWSTEREQKDIRFMLADQPFEYLDLGEDDEIGAGEFSALWSRAKTSL